MANTGLEYLLDELKASTSNKELLDWATEATRRIEVLSDVIDKMLEGRS